jgi:hypothetical protein
MLSDQRLYTVKNVCVRVCVCIYTHTHTRTHISECLETVYELPFLANDTERDTFLQKSATVRSVHCIFIIGVPAWR